MTRTANEILDRVQVIGGNRFQDFFGKRTQVLLRALSYDDLKASGFMRDGLTREEFDSYDDETPASYMPFAIDKMLSERGLSSQRSVDAFREWLWLAFDDATEAEYMEIEYANYGRHHLEYAAVKFELTELWNSSAH